MTQFSHSHSLCVWRRSGQRDQQQFGSIGTHWRHPTQQHQLRTGKNWQPLWRGQAGECQVRLFKPDKNKDQFLSLCLGATCEQFYITPVSFPGTPSLWRGRSEPASTLSLKTLWRSSLKWWWQSLPAWWVEGWSEPKTLAGIKETHPKFVPTSHYCLEKLPHLKDWSFFCLFVCFLFWRWELKWWYVSRN